MRCHICNSTLSPAEVQWNNDHKDWDPCNRCQEAIEAVFTDDSEEEIAEQLYIELEAWEEVDGLPPEKTT